MRFTFPVLVVFIVSACAGNRYSVSSPYFNIPAGTQIIVKQSLTIHPNTARVYLQDGKVVTSNERDQYHYNCWFLSWKIKEIDQNIRPDTFVVTKVRHSDFLVKANSSRQLAAITLNDGFKLAFGGATATEYTTELTIHSDKHPDIRRLVCSYWGDPGYGKHITVSQMQAALGDIAKINIWQPTKGVYEEH